jgi:hypothetical protein
VTGQSWFANWLICTSPVYKISDLGCRDRRPADRIKEINPAPFPAATLARTLGPHGSIEDEATEANGCTPALDCRATKSFIWVLGTSRTPSQQQLRW